MTQLHHSTASITVGITGTRKGMTPMQRVQLGILLQKIKDAYSSKGECWLAHGDCIGVDEEAHFLAKEIGFYVRVHPPSNDKQRAWCTQKIGADLIVPEQIYSVRNHDIVRVSDYVIVVPAQDNELQRGSGTWAVKRYAHKTKTPYSIIYPDGKLEGSKID